MSRYRHNARLGPTKPEKVPVDELTVGLPSINEFKLIQEQLRADFIREGLKAGMTQEKAERYAEDMLS